MLTTILPAGTIITPLRSGRSGVCTGPLAFERKKQSCILLLPRGRVQGRFCIHIWGAGTITVWVDPKHSTLALSRTFQKEEEEPGLCVRLSCLTVTADSSTEVVKRKEATADPPGG